MSLLSRLLGKLSPIEEQKSPNPTPPEPPSGPVIVTIDASQHIVEAVTLFRNDTAQVVRTFHDLKLKSGENTLVIENLPHAMQPESLRVSNSGSYATLDVLCTRERNDEHQQKLEVLVAELEQSKKRREEVMKMLRDFGSSLAVTSTTSQKNMFKFTDKYLSVAEECDAEVRNIEQKLKTEKALLDTWRNSQVSFRGVAQITLFTKRNTVAPLTITYMVNNASWSPLYDLRATSQKGRPCTNVHLHYRANLSQSTGEAWNDAQLTLSTRAPEDLDGGIPQANTVQIRGAGPPSPTRMIDIDRRRRPRPVHQSRTPIGFIGVSRNKSRGRSMSRSVSRSRSRSRSRSKGRSRSRSKSRTRYYRCRSPSPSPRRRRSPFRRRMIRSRSPLRRSRGSISVASEPPQYPFHPNETVMISNDVTSISFIMDGRCSIPGDGKLHRVTIAILPFAATIRHVVTPRVSFDAFLQCSILNDSSYTLLPGVLSTFLDDKYVSKITIPEVGTGDTLRCTLGIDTAVKVTHSITSESSASPEVQFVERLNTVTYTSKTVIRNRRFDGAPIDVVERTSLPVVRTGHGGPVNPDSAEARIKVLLKQPPGLAESESGDLIDLDRPDGFRVQWGTGDGNMGPLQGNIADKEEGKFMWVGKIEPGEEVALESVWDVRAPVNISWSENTVPSRRGSE